MAPAYWKLDQPLHKLNRDIQIKDKDWAKTKKVLTTEIHKLINEMKKNNIVFKRIYRQLTYSGSTYENLKISDANEFDLNIELVLPFYRKRLMVQNSLDTPGFVFLMVEDVDDAFTPDVNENIRREIRKWFDPNGCLLRTKVYQWMQGVLDSALNTYQGPITDNRYMSGPALTLFVDHDECGTFSVDLSPTFPFNLEDWPVDPVRHYTDIIPYCKSLNSKNWYAVPKSPGYYQYNPELWRISFYQYEVDMMNGQEHMKIILKLMKHLRDKQDWKSISSYYLKTIFMWTQISEDSSFWRKGLGELFILMLERIQRYLLMKTIPFFWNQELNFIERLHPDFSNNVACRIDIMKKRILNNLDTNPDIIFVYFYRNMPLLVENTGYFPDVAEVIREERQEAGWCNIL